MSAVLAIVGSRDYPRLDLVREFVASLKQSTVVISGGARGVDRVAADAARKRGMTVDEFHADWDRDGRRAGFLRNNKLVQVCDYLVAFWDGSSTGTAYTIQKARFARKLWAIYGPDGKMDIGIHSEQSDPPPAGTDGGPK